MIFFDSSLSLLCVLIIKVVYTRFQTIIGKIFTINRIHEHFIVSCSNNYNISTATKKSILRVAELKEPRATATKSCYFAQFEA